LLCSRQWNTWLTPWNRDSELKSVGEYGLRNKREIWRVQLTLSKIRRAARYVVSLLFCFADFACDKRNLHSSSSNPLRNSIAQQPLTPRRSQLLTMDEKDPKRLFEGNALIRRLVRVGVLDESRMKLDYVLALKVEDFLERRLQTCVYKLGLAKSIHHARVLIRQRHIRYALLPAWLLDRTTILTHLSASASRSSTFPRSSSALTPRSTSTSPLPRPSVAVVPAVFAERRPRPPSPRRLVVTRRRRRSKLLAPTRRYERHIGTGHGYSGIMPGHDSALQKLNSNLTSLFCKNTPFKCALVLRPLHCSCDIVCLCEPLHLYRATFSFLRAFTYSSVKGMVYRHLDLHGLQNPSESHHAWTKLFRVHSVLLGKRERQIQILLRSRSTSRPDSNFNHCIQYSIQRTHALVDFTRSPQTCSSYYSLSQVVKMVFNLFKDQPRHASTTLYISFKNNISINTINSNNRHAIIAASFEKHTYHCIVCEVGCSDKQGGAKGFRRILPNKEGCAAKSSKTFIYHAYNHIAPLM